MRKVTTINLNNNAYQIDEDGFEVLRAYLDHAARALTGNPDREEILADLEQAIADKCGLAMGPHKSVVSKVEIERIIKEMGPVAGGDAGNANDGTTNAGTAGAQTGYADQPSYASSNARPRRMYRIREGGMWAGVCNGLAAYIGVDVVWLRLAVVLLVLATGFFPGFVIYIAMIFIVPVAVTPEEISAAHGQPFNAQELVDRVKKKGPEWRHERRARRHMRHQATWSTAPTPAPGYAARVTGGVLLPLFTLMSAVWFGAMAIAGYTVWWAYDSGGLASWPLPAFHGHWRVPMWIALVAVAAVYALIAIPIGAGRRAALYYANGGRHHGWADMWSGLLWFAVVAVMWLVASYQLPLLQDLLRHVTGAPEAIFYAQASWPQFTDLALLPWTNGLQIFDGNDLVAALPTRSAHLYGIALLLAHQGSGNG
jgi:phage shock protein PspC (stress-responsive transcriptional regulator)